MSDNEERENKLSLTLSLLLQSVTPEEFARAMVRIKPDDANEYVVALEMEWDRVRDEKWKHDTGGWGVHDQSFLGNITTNTTFLGNNAVAVQHITTAPHTIQNPSKGDIVINPCPATDPDPSGNNPYSWMFDGAQWIPKGYVTNLPPTTGHAEGDTFIDRIDESMYILYRGEWKRFGHV